MPPEACAEGFDVSLIIVAGWEQRLAEDDREAGAPRPPPRQPGPGPAAMRAPDPDRDHRSPTREGDAGDAGSDAHQRVGVRVHRSLGRHGEQDALPDSVESGFQRGVVSFAPTDRDLIVPTQDPAGEPPIEELRGNQEAALPLDPTADLDREDGPVERTDVVERDDGRSTRRQMFEALDARPEHQSDERRDDREADAPPAVQLTPGHERHASVRLMDVLAIRDLAAAQRDRYLAALRTMVNIDCGTFNRDGVNRIVDLCEARFREGGWDVERIGQVPGTDGPELGDQLVGTLRGAGGARVLMVGHMDTVFEDGTASERPFAIRGERAYGPGVSDMKGGLLAGFFALDVLRDAGIDGFERITYVCNPDEEIGSPSSTGTIGRLAADHDAALILESGRANGDVVSSRKGTADFVIRIHGRAAHAGVEPDEGRSAVIEAAHKAIEIADIHRRWPGVTCNVGVLRGGTRSNVVAEEAVLEVDLRSPELATLEEAKRAIEAICAGSVIDGVTVSVRSDTGHRPMEKSNASQRLVDVAVSVADELGVALSDTATGGASDGNTTSAAGCPTLDGLGPVGGAAHSPDEWLDLESVVPRIALLAGVITRV